MTPSIDLVAYERNIRLYPWFTAAFNAFFWLPVFFLYFNSHLSVEKVLLLEAVYYASVVLFEIPSGYFSDSISRKLTLVLASLALSLCYVFFYFGTGFLMFAVAQVLLAVGISFVSGTDTSFHFDSLKSCNRAGEYEKREVTVTRVGFMSGAVAAILGGFIALAEYRTVYIFSCAASILMMMIAFAFREPQRSEEKSERNIISQIGACLHQLRRGDLRWLFLFALTMIVFNHVPYEFYQPYIDLLSLDLLRSYSDTPVVSGLHTFLTMACASLVAPLGSWICRRIGIYAGLMMNLLLLNLIMLFSSLFLHPFIILLLVLRSVPRALMTAPLYASITPIIPQHLRATYLSLQSLAGRLSFSMLLVILSVLIGEGSMSSWNAISSSLGYTAYAGIACMVILILTIPRTKQRHS